jgi:hypothetical protein
VSLLIVVEDIFDLPDGALHLAPGVPFQAADRAHLKPGDQLELRRPDGTVIAAKFHGFDFLVPNQGKVGLSLGKPLTKADVPIGTEVWKVT